MIKFNKIKIQNYKSIKQVELDLTPGIFKVVGNNLDGLYKSNGSGKSSILYALQVGLWNVDPQGMNIGDINNRLTKQPCRIQVDFTIDTAEGVDSYSVINDKKDKKHYLYKNGKLISTQYRTTNTYLMELFGLSQLTFKFLHYITTNSILELTYNLSNSVIFNEILQVTQLKKIRENIKALIGAIQIKLNDVTQKVRALEQKEKLLANYKSIPLESLQTNLTQLEEQIEIIRDKYEAQIGQLEEQLQSLKVNAKSLQHSITEKETTKKTFKCPTCGSVLADEETIAFIESSIDSLKKQLAQYNQQIEDLELQIGTIKAEYKKTLLPLETDRQNIWNTIQIQQELKRLSETFPEGVYQEALEEQKALQRKITNYRNIEQLIKNGEVFEDILSSFFKIVQSQIEIYQNIVRFPFSVFVVPEKQAMRVILKDKQLNVPIESLSNGERARLSLLLLVSLIESIQQLSGNHTNFIVFDEATSSFDKSGIEELRDLFQHLKTLGVSCFIITHGSEMAEVPFDGELQVVKKQGLTSASLVLS